MLLLHQLITAVILMPPGSRSSITTIPVRLTTAITPLNPMIPLILHQADQLLIIVSILEVHGDRRGGLLLTWDSDMVGVIMD